MRVRSDASAGIDGPDFGFRVVRSADGQPAKSEGKGKGMSYF
jgi:hypothetical protein